MADSEGGEKKEKRQVERKYLVFYLRVFEGLSTKTLGHVVNISSEGILLLSDNEMPLNRDYRLRMRLPHEVCEMGDILFSGISRWCKRDTNPDFYLTGFQLHDMTDAAKADILNFLEEYSFLED